MALIILYWGSAIVFASYNYLVVRATGWFFGLGRCSRFVFCLVGGDLVRALPWDLLILGF